MVVNNIVSNLKELGFSEYEARSYIALLQGNPATPYEIARAAGIPTSKIYRIIQQLETRRIIQLHAGGDRKLYIPLAPGELLSRHRNRFDTTLTSLEKNFNDLKPPRQLSYLWTLGDYPGLLEKAEYMLARATKTILLSLWAHELAPLEPALAEARKRDVKIAIVHFGTTSSRAGQIFTHPIEETIYKEKGGRGFVLVCDSREALLGTVFQANQVEGAWSENRGFVTLAEDYIKHDIYIMKIIKRFSAQLVERFGAGYRILRDVYTDKEKTNGDLH